MTTLPTSADFTTTPGSHLAMRTSLAQQRDYLAGLLGADGLPATALAALGSLAGQYVAKTGAYTVTTSDRGKVINCTGTFTLSLPAAATAGPGFSLLVKNAGSGTITLDPSGAELVDGAATLALAAGRGVLLSCTGTAWVVLEIPGKVTQTATDATAGRLLKVGDFGLGATAASLVTDYDALTVTGFYRNNAVATGTPIASSLFWSVLHIAHASDGTAASQLALRSGGVTSNDMWLRRKSGGAWSTWAKVFHSENLLGTVSQTAGVPTGAVIERGANANGEYVKFADGTMICYHTFSVGSIVAAGAGTFDNPYRSNPNVTWTFPAAFSAVPVTLARAVPPAETSASGARQRAFAAVGRENLIACYQIAAVRMGSDATADVFTIDATVTGRWF